MSADAAASTCGHCGCAERDGRAAHALMAALADDDLDRALALGLLDAVACDACSATCRRALSEARDARVRALAARDRYRAREQRLQRRAHERAAHRAGLPATAPAAAAAADAAPQSPAPSSPPRPALPAAAAAALARAKAKAAERKKP